VPVLSWTLPTSLLSKMQLLCTALKNEHDRPIRMSVRGLLAATLFAFSMIYKLL